MNNLVVVLAVSWLSRQTVVVRSGFVPAPMTGCACVNRVLSKLRSLVNVASSVVVLFDVLLLIKSC